jgi:hypothetical protein
MVVGRVVREPRDSRSIGAHHADFEVTVRVGAERDLVPFRGPSRILFELRAVRGEPDFSIRAREQYRVRQRTRGNRPGLRGPLDGRAGDDLPTQVKPFSCHQKTVSGCPTDTGFLQSARNPETITLRMRSRFFSRDRNGRGSWLCSTPRRSPARTSPGSPCMRRLPPRPAVESSNRR